MGALGAKSLSAALLAIACASQAPSARPPIALQAARAPAETPPIAAERRPDVTTCEPARGIEPPAVPVLGGSSAENLRAWVYALAGPELRGREAGTRDALRAARLIADYFARIGAATPTPEGYCQSFVADGYRDQNVIAHLHPERACFVVLGAHYDALGEDGAGRIRPGADDDATGMAVLLEIARLVTEGDLELRTGLVLAAFGAEEKGLVGSQEYVKSPSVPLERVALMINVDMAGRRPGGRYPSIGWEASGPDRRATAGRVIRAAERVRVGAIPMRLGDRGDSASFSPHVPTVFFSTAVHPDYHQPTDTPDRVDYGQVERALSLVRAVLESTVCPVTPNPLRAD